MEAMIQALTICVACGRKDLGDFFASDVLIVRHPLFVIEAPLVLCEICKKLSFQKVNAMILKRLEE